MQGGRDSIERGDKLFVSEGISVTLIQGVSEVFLRLKRNGIVS